MWSSLNDFFPAIVRLPRVIWVNRVKPCLKFFSELWLFIQKYWNIPSESHGVRAGAIFACECYPRTLRANVWATVASTGTEHVSFVFHGAQMKTLRYHCIGNFVLLLIPHYFCTANLEARLERVKWITADYRGIQGHWICKFRVSWGTHESFE